MKKNGLWPEAQAAERIRRAAKMSKLAKTSGEIMQPRQRKADWQ